MSGVLLEVDGQQFQQSLPLGTLDGKAAVTKLLLHRGEVDSTVRLSAPQDKAELSG